MGDQRQHLRQPNNTSPAAKRSPYPLEKIIALQKRLEHGVPEGAEDDWLCELVSSDPEIADVEQKQGRAASTTTMRPTVAAPIYEEEKKSLMSRIAERLRAWWHPSSRDQKSSAQRGG